MTPTPSSVPIFLLFLSLPSPSCRSHPQPDGLPTEMESQAQTPSLQNLRIPKRRGVWAPACTSTEQHLQQQRERQWQRAYPRRQTALKTQEKETTETEARSPLATAYACTVSKRSNPGKIWIPTNQIRVLSLEHTYPAKYVRVHFRHLGVYKESRVAYGAT